MTKADLALDSFTKKGFTCSSSVLSAFSDDLGLDAEIARTLSCGFGAGISKTGNICGAVSGAIMVIGLKYGKALPGDNAATEKTRTLVRRFIDEFTARNGSINCTDLLGYNLSSPEEYEKARESGVFHTKCPDYVRDAANILEEIL